MLMLWEIDMPFVLPSGERLWTMPEVAELLGHHRATVLRWIQDRKLVTILNRERNLHLIRTRDLEEFLWKEGRLAKGQRLLW